MTYVAASRPDLFVAVFEKPFELGSLIGKIKELLVP